MSIQDVIEKRHLVVPELNVYMLHLRARVQHGSRPGVPWSRPNPTVEPGITGNPRVRSQIFISYFRFQNFLKFATFSKDPFMLQFFRAFRFIFNN